jgi:AraC family transcriptional regulator, regulatory protein of adaptative response / methylated-DNA-[protein]-cysteine methyltransferase
MQRDLQSARTRPLPPDREMLQAFLKRDVSYDGVFVAAVSTTGVFCRPSCPARKPKPGHVRFFAGVREALFAGFRPCRRCDPLAASGRQPDWVTRLLKRVAADPDRRVSDRDLRRHGFEPATVRRYFLKHYGMTFHAYARGRRLSGAFEQLRRGTRLDEVIMGNGFESHSGFRDAFSRTFGQAPGRSRSGDCVVCTWIESPLGPFVAGATAQGVCLLEFTDRRRLPAQIETVRRRFGCAVVPGESPYFDRLRKELDLYFSGQLQKFSLPLAAPGTPFQERVWGELQRIPFGETRSYEDLARAVGAPGAQRAVGRANGTNRIAIVIPCHRVINKSGKLGGYGGLLWRKEALLHLERTGRLAPGLPLFGSEEIVPATQSAG